MKILCVTNLFPDSTRPDFAPFNRQQILHLCDLHAIHVITPVPWPHVLRKALEGKKPAPLEEFDRIKVDYPVYFYSPKMMRDLYWRFYKLSIGGVFRKAVEVFRPDLVYATWAYPDCRAAVELSSEAGLPVVMRVHGSDINDFFGYKGRKQSILEAIRRSDAVVSVNGDLREFLILHGADPERIHVIYNGIDRSLFTPLDKGTCRLKLGLDRRTGIIVFAGNLKPVKGVDLLLHAFSGIAREDLQLHILGDGPMHGSLERIASSLGIGDRVFFHGSVAHGEIGEWYGACDLFCLPSFHEGTPNVILEALACGVPVVASDTGGIPEIVKPDSGILFKAGDADGLRDALEKGLARNWDRGGIDCPAGSWASNARSMTDLFESVRSSFLRRESGTQSAF